MSAHQEQTREPVSVAYWVTRPGGQQEAILMPLNMPASYKASRSLLIRLGVAAFDPEKFDDPLLTSATEIEAAQFMVREYAAERDAQLAGKHYENLYDKVVAMAELALSRGLPEQGPAPIAPIYDLSSARATLPTPRNGEDASLPSACIA